MSATDKTLQSANALACIATCVTATEATVAGGALTGLMLSIRAILTRGKSPDTPLVQRTKDALEVELADTHLTNDDLAAFHYAIANNDLTAQHIIDLNRNPHAIAGELAKALDKTSATPLLRDSFETIIANVLKETLADPDTAKELGSAFQTAVLEVQAAIKDDTAALRTGQATADAKLDEILRRMGGFQNAAANAEALALQDLRTLAEAFNETTLTDRAQLIQFLTGKAQEYTSYKSTIDALDDRVAAIANLKGAAQHAAETLNFDEVEELLARVDEVETEIAADTKVARAQNALLRNDPDHAFRLLSAAADSFASIDPLEPARKRATYEDLLFQHSLRYGGTALTQAAQMNAKGLSAVDKAEDPQLWAKLQNHLGKALANLGARSSEPDTIQRAIDAFEAALEVHTREASEMGWAIIQNNLGTALQSLGTRTGDHDTLRRAVKAYRASLEVLKQKGREKYWAGAQNNLGNALAALGTLTGDSDTLRRAIKAYEAALEVHTRKASELHWAETQINLGAALRELGSASFDPEPVHCAIDSFKAVLEIYTRKASEMHWAVTQNNLGAALQTLGTATSDPEPFRRAVVAYEAALEILTQEASEMHWALTLYNHGEAKCDLAALLPEADRPALLAEALAHVDAALEVWTPEAAAGYHQITTNLRAKIRAAIDGSRP